MVDRPNREESLFHDVSTALGRWYRSPSMWAQGTHQALTSASEASTDGYRGAQRPAGSAKFRVFTLGPRGGASPSKSNASLPRPGPVIGHLTAEHPEWAATSPPMMRAGRRLCPFDHPRCVMDEEPAHLLCAETLKTL